MLRSQAPTPSEEEALGLAIALGDKQHKDGPGKSAEENGEPPQLNAESGEGMSDLPQRYAGKMTLA
jgi:hypothetical protein